MKNKKYQGYCCHCFRNIFPGSPLVRNYKTKELLVADFIKTTFPEEDLIFDKVIQGGCSKRRPDIYVDKFTHTVVIEVDENQHYGYSCENKRDMEIFTDFNNRPLIFIRFNPDKYDSEKSCFQVSKNGLLSISSIKRWNTRLQNLKDKFQECITDIPTREITRHLLYIVPHPKN